MAYALMDENYHYTTGDSEHIPTYHVVHSDDELKKNEEVEPNEGPEPTKEKGQKETPKPA